MAKAPVLGLLVWALSVELTGTCLRCWPDAAKYFGYDAKLLLAGETQTVTRLKQLFLSSSEDRGIYGGAFLEREDMEREAGNLFLSLERIIQRSGKDTELILKEAAKEKKNFTKRLEEASKAFWKEICSVSCAQSRFRPYEVAHCSNCRVLRASCHAPIVCAGANVLVGISVTFVLILLGAGAVVWYRRYKKKAAGEAKAQGDDETESSDAKTQEGDTESSESSEEEDKGEKEEEEGEEEEEEGEEEEEDGQSPTEQSVPSPPELGIPSPPELNAPPAPEGGIPSPPILE